MRGSKELFAGVFSRHAAAYQARHEQIRRQGQSRGRARLLDLLGVRPGEVVLDLCCGPGNLGAELAGARVIGVDLAPGMLALAEQPVVLGDAEALPFRDASFDAVACGHGLQFCPDLAAALREARRVLRPGGRFAASVPSSGRDPAQGVLDQLVPALPATPDRDATLTVVNDEAALAGAARAAGFAEARVERVATEVVWPDARTMVEAALEWWHCAARLEGVSAERRSEIREAAVRAVEAVEGAGPVRLAGSDLVLYARA